MRQLFLSPEESAYHPLGNWLGYAIEEDVIERLI